MQETRFHQDVDKVDVIENFILSSCDDAVEPLSTAGMAKGPELPPRTTSHASGMAYSLLTSPLPRADTVHLTPYYGKERPQTHPYSGGFDDPRSSSTQSLRPVESVDGTRRTLLLIYIHGFLGNETSFRSFPAHVHNLLCMTLAETHVIHSKIYPRYKSRKKISFARDDFSAWLTPHESPQTDVILIGHSLGGILAAEVVLVPSQPGSPSPLHHNILGLITFDTPFLGMHPGVISTGITSLFRPAPDDVETKSPAETEVMSPQSELSSDPADPNFNPMFPNDVHLANRKGKLERAFYFWNKHWGELSKATSSYVTSHLEFGGCLADYPGLKRRYDAVRALENVDSFQQGRRAKRVRFVNYYSASTGRIKEREPSPHRHGEPPAHTMQALTLTDKASVSSSPGPAHTPSPRLSVEEFRDGQVVQKELEEAAVAAEEKGPSKQLTEIDPSPMNGAAEVSDLGPSHTTETAPSKDEFPPSPPLPDPPPAFDDSMYTDPDDMKLARKEHERQVKAYERSTKDRVRTLRDRAKLVQKREKAAQKEADKLKKEELKRSSTLNPEAYDKQLEEDARAPQKKQRDRKFCALPTKDQTTGVRDLTWVRVYMEGMDEVVAHTSMFKMSDTYAKLVGDTAARIEEWVKEDATRRAVLEASREDGEVDSIART